MAYNLIAAVVLGFLTGLGTGGGSLLLLWLTQIQGLDSLTARSINLLFFFPAAGIRCLLDKGEGRPKFCKLWPSMLSGVLSAGIFSLISGNLRTRWLEILFGFLLILTGIRELCYKPPG